MASDPADGVTDLIPRSGEYRVVRTPALAAVSPGAVMRYECAYKWGPPPAAIGGPNEPYRDSVRWQTFAARQLVEETRAGNPQWGVPLVQGPFGFVWRHQWDVAPGKYVVGAEISDGRPETRWSFLPQSVDEPGKILGAAWPAPGQARLPSPDAAEHQAKRYVDVLTAVAQKFPPATPEAQQKHEDTVHAWREYMGKLRARLASTDGKRRIPITAFHLESDTQQRRQLNVFLCLVASNPFEERWTLVDWTEPTDRRFSDEYHGNGRTREAAINGALADWDLGNRYPPGHLEVELPAEILGRPVRRSFETSGTNLGDNVRGLLEWVAMGAVLVVGVAALFVPVAGEIAAAALWTAVFSSTAAAGINIYQRHSQGFADWQDDAFDALTIAANLFAAGAAWSRGARILASARGRTVEKIFVGAQIGTGLVQGVAVAADSYAQLDQILKAPDLSPEERVRRLLALLGTAAVVTYISIQATKKDLENLAKAPAHVASEGRNRPPKDKLKDLTDPTKTIDTTEPPAAEGHTKDKKHKTTIQTGAQHHPTKVAPEETELARAYPKDESLWKNREIKDQVISLEDHERFFFIAAVGEDGALEIAIYTVDKNDRLHRSKLLRADKLYPQMYRHFEETGHPVQYVTGSFTEDNFEAVNPVYESLIAAGEPAEKAAKLAIESAKTFEYHKAAGFSSVTKAVRAGNSFKFRLDRPSGGSK